MLVALGTGERLSIPWRWTNLTATSEYEQATDGDEETVLLSPHALLDLLRCLRRIQANTDIGSAS